jgi:hypothetical protein
MIPMIAPRCATALALSLALLASGPVAAADNKVAWKIVEDLTTEIGPRLAGTAAEARAREWGATRLRALGFANVRIEPFDIQVWERGEEKAWVIAPYLQPLTLTALGNSGATPATGMEGEVISFPSLEALKAADPAKVKGRIVYLGHQMRATQDGSSYGYWGAVRRAGPNVAARLGAAAMVIRSIGTDSHRAPHTGTTNFDDDVTPIPCAALSNPDAHNLERIMQRATAPVRMKLVLTPRQTGIHPSGNVIAEVPGQRPDLPIILVGGHLDSWDLGTGAIDDAAGLAITTAAAHRIMAKGRPLRTIRVVWFGAEEIGKYGGGDSYFDRHGKEPHGLVAESDFGADRVWRVDIKLGEAAAAERAAIHRALGPLGVAAGRDDARGGADIQPMVKAGVAVIDLQQDGTRYFDLHHTPDDTLDKIDPVQLEQNVDAWTRMLEVVAKSPHDFTPAKK